MNDPCMDRNENPRILVIADYGPTGGGGGGVILRHLLRGRDWNKIYWWSLFGAAGTYQMGGRHRSYNTSSRWFR